MSPPSALPSPRGTASLPGTLSWLLQLGYTTARLFKQNSLQNHAAATSFYFLLSATPLLLLKRMVKKMIDDEDRTRPLTDEQITALLQNQGINVTRRTVAKYREDMKIPSTHQRRVKN